MSVINLISFLLLYREMETVVFKNSLNNFVNENNIVLKICQKLGNLPNIQTLKYDLEVIKYIANVVENELINHNDDEKKIVIVKVLKALFVSQPFTEIETANILNQITYLIKNKQVKKVSTRKYIYKSIGQWFTKKFL